MKQSHVRQSLVFLEQLAHMRHGHVRLVFLKLVILELIHFYLYVEFVFVATHNFLNHSQKSNIHKNNHVPQVCHTSTIE